MDRGDAVDCLDDSMRGYSLQLGQANVNLCLSLLGEEYRFLLVQGALFGVWNLDLLAIGQSFWSTAFG
jgi:hypothetical protein